MTSPVIPARALSTLPTLAPPVPDRCPTTRPSASGLPVARTADPTECGTLLMIDIDDRGRTAVMRARGEIDMLTVADLRLALDSLLRSGAGTVVADLRDVSFVDCTGIGFLADARRRAQRAGIRLRIVAGRTVARTAAVLDLTDALGLHERG